MNSVLETVADGRIIWVMLLFVVLEVIGLVVLWRRKGIGVAPLPLVVNVLAGLCLMMALRASLVDSGTQTIAFWLVASLCAHVADIAVRWRGTAKAC